ncbi:RcnB family protein [Parasphingorhabdus sp.]|uniref:RcnB family protein n=1 Tax=Parasphingorhabdus sp. TaxID=2709688 RepID=UPI0032659FA2
MRIFFFTGLMAATMLTPAAASAADMGLSPNINANPIQADLTGSVALQRDSRSERRANRTNRRVDRRNNRGQARAPRRNTRGQSDAIGRTQGDRAETRQNRRTNRIDRRTERRAERNVDRNSAPYVARQDTRPARNVTRNATRDRQATQRRNVRRGDVNRDRRVDRRYDRNNNGRVDRRYRSNRSWNRAWRNNQRYNWRRYRKANRNHFRLGRYYTPYRYHDYRRWSIGVYLGSAFYGSRYWINDPWRYRLPAAYAGTRWIRYYDDVLLVDTYTGEVIDVIYNFFW